MKRPAGKHKKVNVRRRIEWAVSVTFVVIVVLVVPILGFEGLTGDLAIRAEDSRPPAVDRFDLGVPYVVRDVHVFPVSSASNGIAPRDEEGQILPDHTLEAFLVSDQGELWIVDRPRDSIPSARVRVFGPGESPESEFLLPSGASLFAPGVGGELWVGYATGMSDTEMVLRYSKQGDVLGEYPLPSGVLARSMSVAPTGELWVQVEESEVDLETYAATYASHLLPIAIGPELVAAPDPIGDALEGNFIGADGRLYALSMETIPQGQEADESPSVLTALSADGTTATYAIPAGYRPFAADADGLVYCEPLKPSYSADLFHVSIGDAAIGAIDILVLDGDGHYASVPVTPRAGANTLAPAVQVTRDGSLVCASRGDGGIRLHTLEPDAKSATAMGATDLHAPDVAMIAGIMPSSGDPYRAVDALQRDYMSLIYAGLVRHNDALDPVPDVARSVPVPGAGVSEDGLTITYELRDDVAWHDGAPVTGDDVVATWRYLLAPATTPRGLPFPGFDLITSVSANGQNVVVELSEPFGVGPEAFFPFILPGHLIDPDDPSPNARIWTEPMGCGPYRLTRWQVNGLWQLEAHDASSRGEISIDTLHVRFAESEDALLSLQTSPVPAVWSWVDPFMLSDLRRDAVGVIERWPTGRWSGLLFNEQDDKLADIAVRRALIDLYPAQELRETVFNVGIDDSAPSLFGHVSAPAETKGSSVAEADVPAVSESIDYASGLRNGWPEIAYAQLDEVRETWARGGLPVVRSAGVPDFYQTWIDIGLLSRRNHEIAAGVFPSPIDAGWGGIFDPSDIPSRENIHGVGVGAYDDAELLGLYAEARGEYDPLVREELSSRIQERLIELSAFMFERAEYRDSARVGTIDGFAPAPYPAGDFWNVESWSVPEGDGR